MQKNLIIGCEIEELNLTSSFDSLYVEFSHEYFCLKKQYPKEKLFLYLLSNNDSSINNECFNIRFYNKKRNKFSLIAKTSFLLNISKINSISTKDFPIKTDKLNGKLTLKISLFEEEKNLLSQNELKYRYLCFVDSNENINKDSNGIKSKENNHEDSFISNLSYESISVDSDYDFLSDEDVQSNKKIELFSNILNQSENLDPNLQER